MFIKINQCNYSLYLSLSKFSRNDFYLSILKFFFHCNFDKHQKFHIVFLCSSIFVHLKYFLKLVFLKRVFGSILFFFLLRSFVMNKIKLGHNFYQNFYLLIKLNKNLIFQISQHFVNQSF